MGWRNQAPTFCMIQPRKKYSSAADWSGVMISVMINRASHCAGRGEDGRSTRTARPMYTSQTGSTTSTHRPSQRQRSRPATEDR